MPEGHGFRARAHHLVGVAAFSRCMRGRSKRHVDTAGLLLRTSWRSLAGVDGNGNRQPGMYTPEPSGYAWVQNFNNGNQNNNDKDWSCRVRAVRK